MGGESWLFAYGSLIFRPDFSFEERRRAVLSGYTRRFFQGSTDHRGVPGAPGRVVTLVPGGRCVGVAYRVSPSDRERVLGYLDEREQGGYSREIVDVDVGDGAVSAITYVAWPGNPEWVGPADLDAIAAIVSRSEGPSGRNRDYVLALADALRALDAGDDHVEALARALVTPL